MTSVVDDIDTSNVTADSSIPTKVFKQYVDICSDVVTKYV